MKEHINMLWAKNKTILDTIFGTLIVNKKTLETKKGYKLIGNGQSMFFLETILVTPNRFRPENKLGDMTFLHGHTVELTKLLQLNQELRDMIVLQRMDENDPETKKIRSLLNQVSNQQLKENDEVQKTVTKVANLSDVMTKWL